MLGCKPTTPFVIPKKKKPKKKKEELEEKEEDPNDEIEEKEDNEKEEAANKERYQRLVRKLIYFSHTRLDIVFIVSVTSQHMTEPKKKHMKAAYRILRYLKVTPGRELFFQKQE